ncbi:hypothetical protein BSKO_08288 [Bryopsis sp. KO-2023]|nr:hypothetical protein BSKO_08288 [Bryopsis sp. KO-2023]
MRGAMICEGLKALTPTVTSRLAKRTRNPQTGVVYCSNKGWMAVAKEEKSSTSSAHSKDLGNIVQTVSDTPLETASHIPLEESDSFDPKSLLVPLLGVGALVGVVGLSAYFKEDISMFLNAFTTQVKEMGPSGYVAFAGLYIVLETLAVPATPLTLTAGYLFGQLPGTLVVSSASSAAAVIAFLIARYAVRDKVLDMAAGNKQFNAIDKAIKKDGFKFVFLLRLSPLLPFAASNYLYGLTSVETGPYFLASFLGMLPGTWAYVSAGSVGRDILSGGSPSFSPLEIGLAVTLTAVALWGAGGIAKNALAEVEEEND